MNKYESVILLDSNLEEEKLKEVINKISDLIKNNGILEKIEEIGKRKLAYEIRKNTEAYYFVFHFESKSEFASELERKYRITEEIIKFIVVRKDD